MANYLAVFRGLRAGRHAVAISADSAISPQDRAIGPNGTNGTGTVSPIGTALVQVEGAHAALAESAAGPEAGEFEERAALIEDGAGVPREWAEGYAALDLSAPPEGFAPPTWRQLVDDGGRFLDRWGCEAAELGWSVLDVFGVHPLAPAPRYDCMGLVPLIRGGEVIAISSDRATIQTGTGALLTYLRRPRPGAVAVWEVLPWPKAAGPLNGIGDRRQTLRLAAAMNRTGFVGGSDS